MQSNLAKVLHPLGGTPLLGHVLNAVESLGIRRIVVVAGHQADAVGRYVNKRAETVIQLPPRGTGHALLQTRGALKGVRGAILVLCGDTPLVRPDVLVRLMRHHEQNPSDMTILSFNVDNPHGYGRILRPNGSKPLRIVEEANATEEERRVREVNSGIYVLSARVFGILSKLPVRAPKNEIYLTDAVERLAAEGRAGVYLAEDDKAKKAADFLMGINSRKDLLEAGRIKRREVLNRLMESGVTIEDDATVFIDADVEIGRDTVICPNTVIEGPSKIGSGCRIGPFARIRAGVTLGNGVQIGNFVEVVRTRVGERTLVKHLSYIGDTELGADANIGAGTITANYDGKKKHRTVIGDQANIGSGTVLIAPVKVGRRAVTGAGSVIPSGHDVAAGQTVAGVPARLLKKGSTPNAAAQTRRSAKRKRSSK